MKKSKKNAITVNNDCLIISMPKEEGGKLMISADSSAEERYIAVLKVLSQVFDYFETQKLLSKETISDLRFLIDEYIESNMASFEIDVCGYFNNIDAEDNIDDYLV